MAWTATTSLLYSPNYLRDEMGGACGTYGEKMCVPDFGIRTGTINLENLGVDVRDK